MVFAGLLFLNGVNPWVASLIAIAAGHGNGLYLLVRAGEPLLGIQSLDSRAAAPAADLDARIGAQVQAICGPRPWPAQTPTLLAWVKAQRPEVYARAGTLCFAKDNIGWNLTGERATEVSDMSSAGLLRLPEASHDAGLMALYGLGDAMALLPRLLWSVDVVGHVTPAAARATGLCAGVPVVAGYFDVAANGQSGWGWEDVQPCFRRSEDHCDGESPLHGAGGEWRVERQRLSWEILRPAMRRGNLRVVTHALVRRIILDGRRATGVEWLADNRPFQARAGAGVILAAGAINSPRILELSGIGQPARMSALGIPVAQ